MKTKLFFIFSLFLTLNPGFAQEDNSAYGILSGYIKDKTSGEALYGSTIYSQEQELGAVSNEYGFFSLRLPKGKSSIQIQYIGYTDTSFVANVSNDLQIVVELEPKTTSLSAVTISSKQPNQNVSELNMSITKLSPSEIKELPVAFGEPDIVKTTQLLTAGVQSSGEGNNGMSVRGGHTDQNLILLDEAIVYNPSHLLGFFSTFNSNAIQDATFLKGGIPSEYGGRLSSVLAVRLEIFR